MNSLKKVTGYYVEVDMYSYQSQSQYPEGPVFVGRGSEQKAEAFLKNLASTGEGNYLVTEGSGHSKLEDGTCIYDGMEAADADHEGIDDTVSYCVKDIEVVMPRWLYYLGRIFRSW